MLALPIATLVLWGVGGLITLLQPERPSKIQYFLVWIMLMLDLALDLVAM
jgi:hypothetical protein